MITDAPPGAALRLYGVLPVSLTGLLWALASGAVGLSRFSGLIAAVVVLASLAITAAIIDFAVRTQRSATSIRTRTFPEGWQRKAQLVAGIAGAAALIGVVVFSLIGLAGLIAPTLCLVLGFALYPLAATLDQREFRSTAIALTIIAVIGFLVVVAVSTALGQSVVGLGAALVLWGTSVLIVRHG